jgi:chromosome segregation ATPase
MTFVTSLNPSASAKE